MPKTKAKRETSIKITKELADSVDRLIEEGNVGYRSRQEFCNDAIRRLIDHYWELVQRLEQRGSGSEEKL